jgi:exosortase E/protease (VPEID-CTERM system)
VRGYGQIASRQESLQVGCPSRAEGLEADSERTSPIPRAPRLALPACLAVALLVAEIWLFKKRFSTEGLNQSDLWWAPFVSSFPHTAPWALCGAAATLLLGRSKLIAAFRAERASIRRPWSRLPIATFHLLLMGGFYSLTARILEGKLSNDFLTPLLPASWVLLGAASMITLGALAVPIEVLARIALRLGWTVLGGLVLGTAIGTTLAETWPLWEPMARGTLWLSDRILGLVFADRIYEPAEMVLGTDAFSVQVSKYCSGYEGVSLFLIFFCVFLAWWRERLRFPQALLLLPLGALGAWFMNAVRIAALIVIGNLASPSVALEGFHVYAGWPLACGIALGSVVLATRISLFSNARPLRSTGVNPAAVYLAPLLTWITATMLTGALSASPQGLYPVRILPVLWVLWIHRREHSHLRLAWSWSSVGLGVAAFGAWAGLVHAFATIRGSTGGSDVVPDLPTYSHVLWWTARVVGTCVMVPVVEELAFRGYLARRLMSAEFERVAPGSVNWLCFILSSLAFGFLHRSWPAGFVAGMIYALAYRRRGHLSDAILAHAVTNALVVVFAVASGDRLLWG